MFEINAFPGALPAHGATSANRVIRAEIPKISGASLGRSTSHYLNAQPQKMPTDLEIHKARTAKDGGLTGPPPAFQSSLLDIQSDIRYVIRQMDAAREKAYNERAVQANTIRSGASDTSDDQMLPYLNKAR